MTDEVALEADVVADRRGVGGLAGDRFAVIRERLRGGFAFAPVASASECARDHVKTHGRTAGQVMTPGVTYVAEDTPVAEAARMLEERRIKRVPVLRDGKVVGILSRADLLRVLVMQPEAVADPNGHADDRVVRAAVDRTLREIRSSAILLNVVVDDGTVHLWGMVEEAETRKAIVAAAETCEGVSKVEGHFSPVPTWA